MGPIGWQEMTAIFVLALILFGPKEMARIGKTVGKAIADFRRASGDLKATFDRELSNLEREGQSGSESAGSISDPPDHGGRYNYGYDAYYDAASKPEPIEAPAPDGVEAAQIAAPEATLPATGEPATPPPAPAEPAGGPQTVAS